MDDKMIKDVDNNNVEQANVCDSVKNAVEEDKQLKTKVKKRNSLAFKIICAVLLVAIAAYSVSLLLEVGLSTTPAERGGKVVKFLIVHIIVDGLSSIALIVLSILGLIRAVVNFNAGYTGKGEIVFFSIFIGLPVIIWVTVFLLLGVV